MKKRKAQLLVGVILLLAVLAVIVPLMVQYIRHEANWSTKQAQNSNAFQLAEGAVDRGYQKIAESTATWNAVKNGAVLPNFNFDRAYADLQGGEYTISITSGPDAGEVTVTTVGRDRMKKETRALKAVYAVASLENAAIQSKSVITNSGNNVQVEWGAVISPATINTNDRDHPQFWSSGNISPQDTNAGAPPNCDSPNCLQWHSYQANIPSSPDIDFEAYKASAQATGTYWGPSANITWPGVPCGSDTTSCATGNVYYIDGNLNITSPGIYIYGTLIVTGNLTLPNGRAGQGRPTVELPRTAWKQYGNDWEYYRTNSDACGEHWTDPTAPASFPGLTSSYKSPAGTTMTFSSPGKVMVNGFTYVGGNLSAAGGAGQSVLVGAFFVLGTVTLGSNNICVFYTEEAGQNLLTTNLTLTRQSWQDIVLPWPAGLP